MNFEKNYGVMSIYQKVHRKTFVSTPLVQLQNM